MSDDLTWNYKPVSLTATPSKQEETSKGGVCLEFLFLLFFSCMCICATRALELVASSAAFSWKVLGPPHASLSQALVMSPSKPGLKPSSWGWQACRQRVLLDFASHATSCLPVLIHQQGWPKIWIAACNTRYDLQDMTAQCLWYLLLWDFNKGQMC